jgi:hypothetical protein
LLSPTTGGTILSCIHLGYLVIIVLSNPDPPVALYYLPVLWEAGTWDNAVRRIILDGRGGSACHGGEGLLLDEVRHSNGNAKYIALSQRTPFDQKDCQLFVSRQE